MGRPINLPAVLLFGLAWGLSEGQLFLVLFSWIERFDLQPVTTGVISFLLIATFQGLWHGLYWDIKVAPDHNIKAWNLPKVMFVHIPNLSFGMFYLITFANPGIFLLMQTLGLIGGTYFMRFPGWSADTA